MSFLTILKNIRDFFWPVLDSPVAVLTVASPSFRFADTEIDFAVSVMKKYSENEDNRRKDVESKATIFVGTFAVAATVLINLAKEFITNPTFSFNASNSIIVILISLTVIYLCKAIHCSIKALERKNYHSLGFPQSMFSDAQSILEKKNTVLSEQYKAVQNNRNVINIKVDYMTMAQLFFKRAVVTVALLSLFFLCSYFFPVQNTLLDIDQILQRFAISGWLLITMGVIIVALIITVIALWRKTTHIEETVSEMHRENSLSPEQSKS